jgi:hypothetical protein
MANLTSDYVYLSNYQDLTKPDWTREYSLALTMESSPNMGDRFGHEFKGWFVAPATTNYRFYLACNDHCELSLDSTAGSTTNAEKIVYSNHWCEAREYW